MPVSRSKKKSVPPSDIQFVPPFQNKRVENWNVDDVADWINGIKVSGDSSIQKRVKKNDGILNRYDGIDDIHDAAPGALHANNLALSPTSARLYKSSPNLSSIK
eukprot:461798_1